MRPIPKELRKEIAQDPFMKTCIYHDLGKQNECKGRIEWEHAFIYAGRQINEKWAIVPVCYYHHRGGGLDKEYNQYRAIIRADIDEVQKKYPKVDWVQLKKYLTNKYQNKIIKSVGILKPPI